MPVICCEINRYINDFPYVMFIIISIFIVFYLLFIHYSFLCSFIPSLFDISKGQMISKGLFGILGFSQKTNEWIRFTVKFMFSEKATKIDENWHTVKLAVKVLSIFVAFSKNVEFSKNEFVCSFFKRICGYQKSFQNYLTFTYIFSIQLPIPFF